ncbi:MAG: amidohydrolase family protein [Planctomycetes bacterium]|nr:amidohydrolase family protein [Planctomycetota bacterium]
MNTRDFFNTPARRERSFLGVFFGVWLAGQLIGLQALAGESFALVGGTVYPVNKSPIADGVVVVQDGKIAAVGPRAETKIPDGLMIISALGRSVIPGLIDASSSVFTKERELDALTPQAFLKVNDALNPFTELLQRVRAEGITTVGIAPPPKRSVGGLGMVVKLADPKPGFSGDLSLRTLKLDSYLTLGLGVVPSSFGPPRSSSSDRLNQYYQMRGLFLSAREYQKRWEGYWKAVANYNKEAEKWRAAQKPQPPAKPASSPVSLGTVLPSALKAETVLKEEGRPEDKKDDKKEEKKTPEPEKKVEKPAEPPKPPPKPEVDLQKEVLLQALSGKLPVFITAHFKDDLAHAIRLKKEFGLSLVVMGASEGYRQAKALGEARIPVVVGPVLLSRFALEFINHQESNAAALAAAGVPVAIANPGGDSISCRHLRLQAAVSVRGGLGAEQALRAVTLEPASCLGVANRVGSLEPGKDADLVILDGPPLSAGSRVEQVFIDGASVFESTRGF